MVGFIVTQTNKAFYGLIKETKSLPKKEDAALIDLKVYSQKKSEKVQSKSFVNILTCYFYIINISHVINITFNILSTLRIPSLVNFIFLTAK